MEVEDLKMVIVESCLPRDLSIFPSWGGFVDGNSAEEKTIN
jgi:hypothetical protein